MKRIWAEMPYINYRVSGDDAKTFLQGQVTQDIYSIKEGSCQYGAYCNPHGRMFANLLLSMIDGNIILRLHKLSAEKIINRLKMFILRSKVTIEPIEHIVTALNKDAVISFCEYLGEQLPEEFSAVTLDNLQLLALPNEYYELKTSDESVLSFIRDTFTKDFNTIESIRLKGGNYHILPDAYELVQPQQTPLEIWGGISYKKGCYVGQEIIARNKYRGKIRKGLAFATIQGAVDIPIGENIIADGYDVGTVIEYNKGEQESICLALMLLEDIGKECQFANTKNITLEFMPVVSN